MTKWMPAQIGRKVQKDVLALPVSAAVGAGAGFAVSLSLREISPKVGLPTAAAPLITAALGGIGAALMHDWKFGAGAFSGAALAYALDVFGILKTPSA
jgi:hypothetical protein